MIGREQDMDEMAVEAGQPDGVSPDTPALLKTCLEQRFKEVLMVRTVVRVIEPSTCECRCSKRGA
jgi:hypothetical protein